jgi:diguanylate cyclase (GGDEF)-like protein
VAPRRLGRVRRSGLFATEQPPRLVLRFALVLSLTIALASAVILVVVYHFAVSQAERAATSQASLVASTLLQQEIAVSDLERRVPPARRAELDRLFRTLSMTDGMLAVSLIRRDGLVTYSTDRRALGTFVSPALATEAASGTVISRTGSNAPGSGGGATKALETFAPVRPGKAPGAALILQSYDSIHEAARSAQLRVGAVLEGLLLALILVFVPLLARVTRRISRQIERIHFQAFFDELTGLPNREHLVERLVPAVARATRDGRRLAVLHLDLDRFREINNTLGHNAGNLVLVETAARLNASVGETGIVARLGGDEFAIVVEYETDSDVTKVAERVRSAIEPVVVVGGMSVAVNGTLGIAYFPKDAGDAETLLKHAEVATYTAKEWHIGQLKYSPAVDAHDPEQLELVGSLQEAAENGQLCLHYQPRIDLRNGALSGFEALAYWDHPLRGMLPPGAFIPLAERTGAVRHVTQAVLTRAVEQLREWSVLDGEFTVAVNLTATDLLDPKLPALLRRLLRRHAIEPGRLCLELTEGTVMAVPDRARRILERIAALGVQVAIDDFGTGHSSLAYLKNLPVHELKIDKSFVADMTASQHDRMIVLAAVQLGHSLGLRVVAEGVETAEADIALRELDCDFAQGYFYGRPQPPDVAAKLLEDAVLEAA